MSAMEVVVISIVHVSGWRADNRSNDFDDVGDFASGIWNCQNAYLAKS